jgi:hypothetical protein
LHIVRLRLKGGIRKLEKLTTTLVAHFLLLCSCATTQGAKLQGKIILAKLLKDDPEFSDSTF